MLTKSSKVFSHKIPGFWISIGLITFMSISYLWAGDFVHLNTTPLVLHTASISGTPVGVATDASGHIIVVTEEGTVYSLTTTGAELGSVTLSGSGDPVAITMNDVGDIYIAKGNGNLYRLNTGLAELATATVTGTPVDITVDIPGNVYIATTGGTIYKRTRNLGALPDNSVAGTPTAIEADGVGNIFVTTSGGAVYRLNAALTELASGSVPGSPVDVATDAAGHIIVASGDKLYSITAEISELTNRTLSGTLIGVDLDNAGHVVAANSSGTVFVVNTGLTSHNDVPTGVSLSDVAINLVGDIYAVGGTGTTPTPAATYSTTHLDFGTVDAGASATLSFSVTSTGTAPLEISSINIITSDPPGVWSITPAVPPPINLSPTNSQTFTVTLDVPAGLSSDVTYNATIEVTTNAAVDPVEMISVTGIGHVLVAKACYSATSLNFSQVNTGTSDTRTFTITSCGDLTLEIQEITITTTDPAGVWTVSPAVPPAINLIPPNSHTFTVTLNVPSGLTSDVPYSATITVTTNDQVNPPVRTISANGTGHVPLAEIYIDPIYYDIDYREVEIGFHFGRPLVIENRGDLELTLQISYVDPADPDRFHFNFETDAEDFTIPPFGSQIFRQTFAPTDVGFKDIELIAHNTNDQVFTSQNIYLHGEGTTPIPIDAVLILDRSGSMAETAGEIVKIEGLSRAATLFINLLMLRGDYDYLGLTKYDDENSNILNLGPIGTVGSTALDLVSEIDDPAGIAPRGRTGIGGAMQTASEHYAFSPDPAGHKQVMVVLTDGKENEEPYIRDVLDGYDTYPGLFAEHPDLLTYAVGLGRPNNINEDRLQEITNRGEGGFHLVTGNLENLSVFNLENFYFKIFADAIGHTMVIDPTYSLGLGEALEVPIGIITEDREALFFFIGELPEGAYIFELIDPQNQVITSTATIGGMSVHVKRINNWSLFRVKFPPADINRDYVGIWKFRVQLDPKWADSLWSMSRLTEVWVSPSIESGRHRMSFAASVGSDYKLAASLAPGIVLVGEPIHMRAALTEGGWPSPNARVDVVIRRPDGGIYSQRLYDDGVHGDDAAGDGIFGETYTSTVPGGTYRFDFRSDGVTERGESVVRVASRSQFVGAPSDDPKPGECIPPLRKLYTSFHVGVTYPLGDLDSLDDSNIHVREDITYLLNDRIQFVAMVGLSQFTAEWDAGIQHHRWFNASINLKALFPAPTGTGLRYYLQGGPGYYLPKTGSNEFGFNVGAGAQIPIVSPFSLEFGADYHRILTDDEPTDFLTFQLGVLFR